MGSGRARRAPGGPRGSPPRRLAGLGTRLSENQQAQDGTEQVADVNSQATSDHAAVAPFAAFGALAVFGFFRTRRWLNKKAA